MRRDPFDRKGFSRFYDTPVAFYGTRPNARPIAFTVQCMVVEDAAAAYGEAVAPTLGRMFNVSFPRSAWLDATPPQIGEWMKVVWCGSEMWLKVGNVGHMPDGDYSLSAEWKPGRRPSWYA